MVAVLHNIRSVHNVGAIFRTADGAGIEKLYLCGFTPTPFNKVGELRPQFSKVALGASKYVPWETRKQTFRCIDELKNEGFRIIALEQHTHATPLPDIRITSRQLEKTALVVGHETRGLSQGILDRADHILEIPMWGHKESLNVSVAFGIGVYALRFLATK